MYCTLTVDNCCVKVAYTAIRLSHKIKGKKRKGERRRRVEEKEEGSPILWVCDLRLAVHFLNLILPYS